MRNANKNGERPRVMREGEVRIIEFGPEKWRLTPSLGIDAVSLVDDASGEVLAKQDPELLGFTRIDGEWHPDGKARDVRLTAFAIAWIALHQRH